MTNENQTAGKKQRKLGLTSVILIALARIYHTSTDYLLDLTDVCAPYPPKK